MSTKIIHLTNEEYKIFFDITDKKLLPNLMMTEQALYSASTVEQSKLTTNLIGKFVRHKNIRIYEFGSSAGANTMEFAKKYKVTSFEKNITVISCLVNNLNIEGLSRKVTIVPGDCVKKYSNVFNQKDKDEKNVLFFDPPWGGPEYNTEKGIVLGYTYEEGKSKSFIPCDTILKDISKNNNIKLAIVKIPKNTDLSKYDKKKLGFKYRFIIDFKDKYGIIYKLICLSNVKPNSKIPVFENVKRSGYKKILNRIKSN